MNKNRNIILLIFMFSFNLNLFAQDLDACHLNTISPYDQVINLLAKVSPVISWWSAPESAITNKVCKEKISLKDIEEEINRKSSVKSSYSPKVNNVQFENESPELVQVFENLTSKIDFYGEKLPSIDVQKKYTINPTCKKFKCAVEKIFGKELGNKLAFLNLKYGFNGSELAFENSSRLTLPEVNSLLSAAQSFPSTRLPLDRNKQLTKFKRSHRLKMHDESVLAFAAITFYDGWSAESDAGRESTAFHEMGHYIASELDLRDSKEWLALSGWVEKKNNDWKASKSNVFVSKYAESNASEDFAETVVAYRYNPKLLLAVSPDKYQFMKELVFDGLEYLNEAKCHPGQSHIAKLAKVIPGISIQHSTDYFELMLKSCGTSTSNYLLQKENSSEELSKCFKDKKLSLAAGMAIDKMRSQFKYPDLVKKSIMMQKIDVDNSVDDSKEIKYFLRKRFVNDIYLWDQDHIYAYKVENNARDICKSSWGKYGYQAAFAKDENLQSAVIPYSKTVEYNNFFVKLCEKIHNGKTAIWPFKAFKPFTKAEIENALGPIQ